VNKIDLCQIALNSLIPACWNSWRTCHPQAGRASGRLWDFESL